MTWGIPTPVFLQFHILVSLLGIATGLIVVYGLLTARPLAPWTVLCLATLALTSITGFPLEPFGFDPARALGAMSLAALATATASLYLFQMAGAWRLVYIASILAAIYFDLFAGVTQAFLKFPLLHALAPTQSEPPFVIAQLTLLAAFILFGVRAAVRFRPDVRAARAASLVPTSEVTRGT
jgi:hypothetical protein